MTVWLQSKTTLPAKTGVPDQATVITLAWIDTTSSGDGVSQATAATTKIDSFLKVMNTNTVLRWSQAVDLSSSVTEVVNLAHSRPRIPITTTTHGSAGQTTDAGLHLPPEVALVVSYGVPKESGQNPRRRRGRYYFGPLQVTATITDYAFPPSNLCLQLLDAFAVNLMSVTQPRLAVYSRYTHGGLAVGEKPPAGQFPEEPEALPASFVIATHAYVDDAWDTQRRRGVPAGNRFPYPVSLGSLPAESMGQLPDRTM